MRILLSTSSATAPAFAYAFNSSVVMAAVIYNAKSKIRMTERSLDVIYSSKNDGTGKEEWTHGHDHQSQFPSFDQSERQELIHRND